MKRIAIVLLIAGCGAKKGPLLPAEAPSVVSWTESVDLGGGIVRFTLEVSQTWSQPEITGDRTTWSVSEAQVGPDGRKVRTRYDVFQDSTGYGVSAADGAPFEPPELILAANAAPGTKWSATHTHGERTFERSCEVLESDLCSGGLVSVCDTQVETGRTVIRQHFCPNVGWSGYESLHQAPDAESERRWTDDVRRDGVKIP